MGCPHTTFSKGTTVRVVLRSGEVLITKFVERKPKYIILQDRRLSGREVKSITIYKESENKGEE